MFTRLFAPKVKVSAHCDLPCGVYDPAQARIEAESVKAVQEKYQANEDPHFRARAIVIKEQRAELAKHHVSVLWSDYFKAPTSRSTPSSTPWSTTPSRRSAPPRRRPTRPPGRRRST